MAAEFSSCLLKTFVAVENCGENRYSALTEKATNRGTIKISPNVLDWLNEEQYRRWKNTGKEPTQNELIREVIEIARHPERLEFNSSEAHSLQLSEETRKYIQLLISVLENGWKDTIATVQQNLHRIYLTQQTAVLETKPACSFRAIDLQLFRQLLLRPRLIRHEPHLSSPFRPDPSLQA